MNLIAPTSAESEVLDCLPATTSEVADALGIQASSVRGYLSRLRAKGHEFERDEDGCVHIVTQGVTGPETTTRQYEGQPVSQTHEPKANRSQITRKTNEHLYGLKNRLNKILQGAQPIVADGGLACTPGNYDMVFHLTDLHIGAWQRDEFDNTTFSVPIAVERVREIVRHNLENKRLFEASGFVFDTAHVLLGGDTVDGENIYNHQPHEIECTLDKQIDVATELLFEIVTTIAGEFPTVQVICQSGNHGEIRAKSMSEAFNADSIVYSQLDRIIRVSSLDNVTFVRNESTEFTNFGMRIDADTGIPKWRGHLRHGDGQLGHIGTSSPKNKWGMYVYKHKFNVAYRGHYHEFRVEPIHGVPVVMGPSISEPGDFEDMIGVHGVPGAVTHLVSDDYPVRFLEPLTFSLPEPVV